VGCASPPPAEPEVERQIREIESVRRLALSTPGDGLARQVELQLSLTPKDPLELEVLGVRPEGQVGSDGLVEVAVRWKDHLGVRPDSRGGSFRTTLPMGPDGTASQEQPFTRSWTVNLPEPEARVLARSVSVSVKLHPVDLRSELYRTAGVTVPFDGAALDSFAPAPEGDAAAVRFLDAVAAGQPERDLVTLVGAALAALPEADGADRDALFGALHFLSGQTNGRSVARWQTWWEAAQRAGDPTLPTPR